MITITNGKQKFKISKRNLWERQKELRGIATKLKYEYWQVELLFIESEKGIYKQIVKCYPDGDDFLKVYPNLCSEVKDVVLLSKEDYKEVKTIYDNMHTDVDYKKEAIIESGAILLSYEYYQNCILELDEYSIETVFNEWVKMSNNFYEQYKKQIYARAKKILKEKYNVTNIKTNNKLEGK